jgi:hypothetical protein
MVEMIRSELLPFANNLPNDFMSHIIDILNRGSISTMDSTDVMGI